MTEALERTRTPPLAGDCATQRLPMDSPGMRSLLRKAVRERLAQEAPRARVATAMHVDSVDADGSTLEEIAPAPAAVEEIAPDQQLQPNPRTRRRVTISIVV